MVCSREKKTHEQRRVNFVWDLDARLQIDDISLGEEEEEEGTHSDQSCGEIHQRDQAGDSHGFGVVARVLRDAEHGL